MRRVYFTASHSRCGNIQINRISTRNGNTISNWITSQNRSFRARSSHAGNVVTSDHCDKTLTRSLLRVISGRSNMSGVLQANVSNSDIGGLFHCQFYTKLTANLPQRRLTIDNRPPWALTFNGRSSIDSIATSLQFSHITAKQLRPMGEDAHGIGCYQHFRRRCCI